MYKICLDYGHGGNDPGAAYKERKESNDNLILGLEIAKELRRHGIHVGEIRNSDKTISLQERSKLANTENYDYFISIHRNAFSPEKALGVETFVYLSGTSESKGLAEKIQRSLVDIGFTDRGVKSANFHVLRETKAPAVLIEIGFLDNTKDNELFDSKRDEIIRGITEAIFDQLGISAKEKESVDRFKESMEVLVENGVINTPEYWTENAREGKVVKGEYAAILIERIAAFLMGK